MIPYLKNEEWTLQCYMSPLSPSKLLCPISLNKNLFFSLITEQSSWNYVIGSAAATVQQLFDWTSAVWPEHQKKVCLIVWSRSPNIAGGEKLPLVLLRLFMDNTYSTCKVTCRSSRLEGVHCWIRIYKTLSLYSTILTSLCIFILNLIYSVWRWSFLFRSERLIMMMINKKKRKRKKTLKINKIKIE